MKLRSWLKKERIPTLEFAGEVGVSQATIVRLCNGSRQPSLDLLHRIVKRTKGEVTYLDFLRDDELDAGEEARAA